MTDQDFGTVALDLRHFQNEGYLIHIEVTGLSMLDRRATSAELGFADDDPRIASLTKGVVYTTNPATVRRLKSIHVSMRRLLRQYTYEIFGFSPYYFMPWSASQKWEEAHNKIVARWDDAKNDLLQNLDTYRRAIPKHFLHIADRAWEIVKHSQTLEDGRRFEDRNAYRRYVIQNAMQRHPTHDDIEQNLRIIKNLKLLVMRSDIEEELTRIAAARQERDLITFETEETKRQLVMMIRETQAKERQEINNVFGQLRERIYGEFIKLSESIKRNGTLISRSKTHAKNLIEYVRIMDVSSDIRLYEMMGKLEAMIDVSDASASTDQMIAHIDSIIDTCSVTTSEERHMEEIIYKHGPARRAKLIDFKE